MGIELIVGPMCAFKTSELFRRLRRARHGKKEVCLVRSCVDTRGDDAYVATTHDGVTFEAVPTRVLDVSKFQDIDVVGLDEGQFFGEDIVDFCVAMLKAGKTVIIAALNGSATQKPMGFIPQLYPLATRIDLLSAVCTVCGDDAPYTRKMSGDEEEEVEIEADAVVYEPRCVSCFFDRV